MTKAIKYLWDNHSLPSKIPLKYHNKIPRECFSGNPHFAYVLMQFALCYIKFFCL